EDGINGLNVVLGILDANVVLIVADRIDPEILLVELNAGVERGYQIAHHVRLRQTDTGRLGTVDFDEVLGIVKSLQDAAIYHARDVCGLFLDGFGDLVGLRQLLSRNAYVDGGRFAFVQGAADHAARVKRELELTEFRGAGETFAKDTYVILCGVFAFR